LVRFDVHLGLSSRLGTSALIFLDLFIPAFNGVMLLVIDDVLTQSFGGVHRDRVYVRVFIGVSVRAC